MSPTKFNSNQFFSILETKKLKYTSMETYLSKQVLTDDSYHAMEKFYNSILRTINMGLSTQLYFLPRFKELCQDTNFTSLFLDGLFGSNVRWRYQERMTYWWNGLLEEEDWYVIGGPVSVIPYHIISLWMFARKGQEFWMVGLVLLPLSFSLVCYYE
jgi:hypothetical protein